MSNTNYDAIADVFLNDRQQSTVKPIIEQFAALLQPKATVLDVGCGAGVPNAKYLSEHGVQVMGIDISAKLLDHARRLVPQAQFIHSDIIEFETDQKFDGILAWDSLFHLPMDKHKNAFKKIALLLKNRGYFLFTHGGLEKEIVGEMYGKNFYYSSPGADKIKYYLQTFNYNILEWNLDTAEENGYLTVLAQKAIS